MLGCAALHVPSSPAVPLRLRPGPQRRAGPGRTIGGHAATHDCRHASRVRTPTAAVVDPTQHRLAAFHGSALFLSCRHTLSAINDHRLTAVLLLSRHPWCESAGNRLLELEGHRDEQVPASTKKTLLAGKFMPMMPWLRLCIMGLIVHRCPAGDVSGGLARGKTLRLNGGAGSRVGLPFGTESTEPILRGREEWEHHDAPVEGVRVKGMKVTAENSSRFRTPSPDTSTAGDGSRRPRDLTPPNPPDTPSTPRTPRTPTALAPRPDARETLAEMTGESSLPRGPVLASHDPDAAASEDAGKQESSRERGEDGVNVWEECERTFPEYAVAYDECLTQQDFVDQQVQLAAEYGKQCELVKAATCPTILTPSLQEISPRSRSGWGRAAKSTAWTRAATNRCTGSPLIHITCTQTKTAALAGLRYLSRNDRSASHTSHVMRVIVHITCVFTLRRRRTATVVSSPTCWRKVPTRVRAQSKVDVPWTWPRCGARPANAGPCCRNSRWHTYFSR